MGILGDEEIHAAIQRGDVVIRPMAPDAIGSNSIDLHLGPHLAVYVPRPMSPRWQGLLRTDSNHNLIRSEIDLEQGSVLVPGELYLCATVEYTCAGPYVPLLEGTSSAGRLGISVHATAGVGDVGFAGHWTLEVSVVRPVLVFGGESIAQLILHTVEGQVKVPYDKKPSANYANADPRPQPSRLWNKPRWLG